MPLTNEQNQIIDRIIAGGISVLHGAAGTGKTEVIAEVSRRLGPACVVLSPTHKAAINLRERGVDNVHMLDGLKVTSVQVKLRDQGVTHIIVDESSMVGDEARTLIESASRRAGRPFHIVYVGDPRQLPPVSRGAWTNGDDWFAKRTPDSAHKTYLRLHRGDKLVCYTNKRGGNNSHLRNNCLITVTGVEYTRANGKAVYRVSYQESQKPIDIPKSCFKTAHYLDPAAPKQEFELAYAITAHSAQGSGYDNVVVHLDRSKDDDGIWSYPLADMDAQRWLYTAMTRAKKSVHVIDPTGAIEADTLDLKM